MSCSRIKGTVVTLLPALFAVTVLAQDFQATDSTQLQPRDASRLSAAVARAGSAPAVSSREGACYAVLENGAVVMTGGSSAAGAVPDAAIYGSNGNFVRVAPMLEARRDHVCAALPDGTLLVAGGRTAAGPLSSAEIYHPADDTWTPAEPMAWPRASASAVTLLGGRVLIAGGETAYAPLQTLEMYDPYEGRFLNPGVTMASRRSNLATARLKDGRIVLAGGFDGNNALATLEIFDPVTGRISGGAPLSVPRAGLAATRLMNGDILFTGGHDGQADLASAEVFHAATGRMDTPVAMPTARRNHSALSLPQNNTILLVGGTNGGTPVTSGDLYIPWRGEFRDAAILRMKSGAATAAALRQPGSVVLAGLRSRTATSTALTADSGLWPYPIITTDKPDYQPGDIVTFTGINWAPNETVTLVLTVDPATHPPVTLTATTDADGNFTNSDYIVQQSDLGVTFYTTATGSTGDTAAVYSFTDGYSQNNLVYGINATGTGRVASVTGPGGLFMSITGGQVCSGGSPETCNCTHLPSENVCRNNTAAVNSSDSLSFTAAGNGFQYWSFSGNAGASGSTCTNGATANPCTLYGSTTLLASATLTAVYANPPTISSFTPSSGAAGVQITTFTVNGSNFSATAANNTITVGTASATASSCTTTQCHVTLTASNLSQTAGQKGVSITYLGQTGAASGTFSLAPSVTSFTPTSGTYGTAIATFTVTGVGFSTTAANNVIHVGTANVTATSCTSTTCTVVLTAAQMLQTTGALNVSITTNSIASANAASTFTLGKPNLTITANADSKTYGAAKTYGAGSTAFTSSGLVNGETIGTVTITDTNSGGPATAAAGGTYALTPSAATGGTFTAANYNITYTAGALTVNKAALTVTANADTKPYGTARTYGANSTAFTSSGLQNSETIGSVTITDTNSGGLATAVLGASYALTPSAATGGTFSASNYNITYTAGTLTVGKASLTITANADSKTYGQTKTYGAGSTAFSSTGLQNGDTIGTVTITDTNSGGIATAAAGGTYALTPGAATGGTFTAGNYNITYTTGTLTVNKASLAITANDDSKTYGQTKSWGSGSSAFTSSGLQNSQTIGSVTITDTNSGGLTTAAAGGTYALTPGAATGGTFTASNYNITYNAGTLTVNKLTLNGSTDNKTRAYGAANPTFTVTLTGFLNGATQTGSFTGSPSCSTAATATTAVGTASITCTAGTLSAANYSVGTISDGTLTISPASLTVTANADSKTYGQTKTYGPGSTAFSSTGLQNGETIGTVTITDTNNGGLSAAVAGGTYPLTPSAATGGSFNSNNYTISYTAGALTVSKATQSTPSVTGPASITSPATSGVATASGGNGTGAYVFSAGSSTGCAVSGSTVLVTDFGGTCSLSVIRSADTNYLESASSSPSSVALIASGVLQTITITNPSPLSNISYGSSSTYPVTMSASSSSGLTVVFSSSTTNVCGVSSGTVSIAGVGQCTINANQSGNGNYAAAPTISQGFVVTSPLAATAGAQRVSLNWRVYSGETTGYAIYKCQAANTTETTCSGTWGQVLTSPSTIAPGTATYTVTGLTNGVKYFFYVRAIGLGVQSAIASAKVGGL